MINEILREVSTLEVIEFATMERVLLWAQRVEAQMAQKVVLNNIKEAKEFDFVRHSTPQHGSEDPKKQKRVDNCKCSGTGNLFRHCLAYGKQCRECGKPNHFKTGYILMLKWQIDCRPNSEKWQHEE